MSFFIYNDQNTLATQIQHFSAQDLPSCPQTYVQGEFGDGLPVNSGTEEIPPITTTPVKREVSNDQAVLQNSSGRVDDPWPRVEDGRQGGAPR